MNTEEAKEHLRKTNALLGTEFQEIPKEQWPQLKNMPRRVYRNDTFLVLVFLEENWVVRLSVCRTDITEMSPDKGPIWSDGITWDQLNWIKNTMGYEHRDAVEVYPAEKDLVNVANFRHIWVLGDGHGLNFIWRKSSIVSLT